jgi:hypothetical protein
MRLGGSERRNRISEVQYRHRARNRPVDCPSQHGVFIQSPTEARSLQLCRGERKVIDEFTLVPEWK